MLIDVHRLRTFVVAAEERNFTQAGRLLNFSQSAVSQQIRELEDQLGVRLFERRGRAVMLTPAGEQLLPRAVAILRDVENAGEALAPFRGAAQGVLRIGASNTLGIYMLPYVLGQFSRRFPAVRATMRVAGEADIVRALQEGELDVALLETEPTRGRLFGWDKQPVLEDQLALMVGPDHPWAKRGRIELETLREGEFLMRQADSPTRQLICDSLAEAGFNPAWLPVRFELGHTEGLKRAVMAGLGVSWASRYALTEELAHGTIATVEVVGLSIRRSLWLLKPAEDGQTEFIGQFCAMLQAGEGLPESMRSMAGLPVVSAAGVGLPARRGRTLSE